MGGQRVTAIRAYGCADRPCTGTSQGLQEPGFPARVGQALRLALAGQINGRRRAAAAALRGHEPQITGFQAIGTRRYFAPSFSTWPIEGKVKWKPTTKRLLGRRHVVEFMTGLPAPPRIDVIGDVPVRIAQEEFRNVGDVGLDQDFESPEATAKAVWPVSPCSG
jgi:hypothetical protein